MSEKWKSKKIGVTALCRVSAKGGQGIYLYIPKNFADVYRIAVADYVEVLFGKIFIKVSPDSEPKRNVVDLRSRSKLPEGKL